MAPRPGTRATRTQSALARACRGGTPDPALLAEMRRQLAVDRLADRLEEIARNWPPLTAEQKADLSVLLSQVPVEDQESRQAKSA